MEAIISLDHPVPGFFIRSTEIAIYNLAILSKISKFHNFIEKILISLHILFFT